ncbi:MAG: hypothetical protein AAF636_16100 [Pseudomonadota bacterium]
MKNHLDTAKRSILLAECEAPGNLGIRPVEREQVNASPTIGDYNMAFFKDGKIEAYKQTPNTPVTVQALAKALVFVDSPFSAGDAKFSVDIIAEFDNEVVWIGWVIGDEIWIDESEEVNGYYTLKSLLNGTEIVMHFNPVERWYELAGPVPTTLTKSLSRRGRGKATASEN